MRFSRCSFSLRLCALFVCFAFVGVVQADSSTQAQIKALLSKLKHKDWSKRWGAVKRLAKMKEKAIPGLLGVIQHSSSKQARGSAISALERMKLKGHVQVISVLSSTFQKDKELSIRLSAGSALRKMKPTAAQIEKTLVTILNKATHWRMHYAAARLLGQIHANTPAAVSALMEHARGAKNYNVRKMAVRALGEAGAKADRASGLLLKLFQKDKHWRVRRSAAAALCKMGSEAKKKAIPVFLQVMRKAKERTDREAALEAIGRIGLRRPGILPHLLRVVSQDKSWIVRAEAAKVIGKMGPKASKAVARLKKVMVQDKHENVRNNAVGALGQIKAYQAIPALIRVLQTDKSGSVRSEAAKVLGEFGANARKALPALTRATKDSDGFVQMFAESARKQIQKALRRKR